MVEFTHAGAWFRWKSLDATSKRLFTGSTIAGVGSLQPLSLEIMRVGAELHEYMHDVPLRQAHPNLTVGAAVFSIGMGALSAWLWWRFSLRQDEMFNRIQNWTLGMTGGWLAAAIVVWTILARADVLPRLTASPIIVLLTLFYTIFWFRAVRRCGASD